MKEKKDKRGVVRLIQLISFFGAFYVLINVVLNYLILAAHSVAYLNDPAKTKSIMAFKAFYVYKPPKGFDLPMVLIAAFAVAIYVVFKLDTHWHVTHDNKEIKGNDRFLCEKELKKLFYSFPADDMESAEKSGIILAYENGSIKLLSCLSF